jgi:hypothetical protein
MVETNAELFANSAVLLDPMGYWPSFHDATVKEVRREGDACWVSVHVFEMADDVDSKGNLVLTKHHLVTLRMSGIAECTVPANYRSDCLFGLEAERVADSVKVVFDSAIDPEFTWHVLCRRAEVVSAVSCVVHGHVAV